MRQRRRRAEIGTHISGHGKAREQIETRLFRNEQTRTLLQDFPVKKTEFRTKIRKAGSGKGRIGRTHTGRIFAIRNPQRGRNRAGNGAAPFRRETSAAVHPRPFPVCSPSVPRLSPVRRGAARKGHGRGTEGARGPDPHRPGAAVLQICSERRSRAAAGLRKGRDRQNRVPGKDAAAETGLQGKGAAAEIGLRERTRPPKPGSGEERGRRDRFRHVRRNIFPSGRPIISPRKDKLPQYLLILY